MTVDVVIVNWNGGEAVSTCLSSISSAGRGVRTIWIVDNGSTDGSCDPLSDHPHVRLLRNEGNLGFAKAANQGARAALASGAESVLFFNNDAELRPGAVERLIAATVRHPEAGLFAPRIYADRDRRTLWSCGVDIGFGPNLGRLRGFLAPSEGRFLEEGPVDSLTGCALLVRRSVFERIGFLDEDFFVYGEDAEFCERAAKAGIGAIYVPDSEVVHAGGRSTGGGYSAPRKYLSGFAIVLFHRKQPRGIRILNSIVCDVLLWPATWLGATLRGEGRAARAKWAGMWDGLRRRSAEAGVRIWSRKS